MVLKSMFMAARKGTFSASREQKRIHHCVLEDLDCLDSTNSNRRSQSKTTSAWMTNASKKLRTETPCFSQIERASYICRSLATTLRKTIG